MPSMDTYPAFIDAVWNVIKCAPEGREQAPISFSDDQALAALGIENPKSQNIWSDGIGEAHRELVQLGYCEDAGEVQSAFWPAPTCPDVLPSAYALGGQIAKLTSLQARILWFLHQRLVRHEDGITFYSSAGVLLQEAAQELLPDVSPPYLAYQPIHKAVEYLCQRGYLYDGIGGSAILSRVTLKGACWLLIGAPLLALVDRAAKLTAHPETSEAAQIVLDAHSRSDGDAARDVTVAIEKLENAVGGERKLADFLGQPKTYIGDLKQSAQQHRHATTTGRQVLDHQQRLARAREIVEHSIEKREQEQPNAGA